MSKIRKQCKLTCLPMDNPYLLENWLPIDTGSTASTPELEVIGEIAKGLNSGKGDCTILDARDITTGLLYGTLLPGHIPMMGARTCRASQSALQTGGGA